MPMTEKLTCSRACARIRASTTFHAVLAGERRRARSDGFIPTRWRVFATLVLLCSLLFSGSCGSYAPEGARSRNASRLVSPKLIKGEHVDLADSYCDLPEKTTFILRVMVYSDGSMGDIQFTKGEPDACIASFIRAATADWVFEPATQDGEPVDVYYMRTINTPR